MCQVTGGSKEYYLVEVHMWVVEERHGLARFEAVPAGSHDVYRAQVSVFYEGSTV
jgi:hypothetical protein